MVFVALQDRQRLGQERKAAERTGLLAVHGYPELPVDSLIQILGAEIFDIRVGQVGVAAKHKNVPHLVEAVHGEDPFGDLHQFLFGKRLSEDFLLDHAVL